MYLLRYGLFFAALSTIGITSAQTTVQVGTGTSTTNNAPIQAYYNFSYSQCIYTAADLVASGATTMGTITKIRYYFNSGASTNSTDWTVHMAHTNKTNFTSTTDWVSSTGMSTNFSGTVTFPATGNWLEITLSTPFQWNGVDNILIGIDENQAGYGSQTYWRYSNYGSDNRSIFYYSDATNPDPVTPPTAISRGTWAPNVQFEWTAAPVCAGTPAHATTTVNDASICPGQSVNLGMINGPFESGITYIWQENTGSGWSTISGPTAASYTTAPAVTSDYRIVQTCTSSGLADTAASVNVVLNPIPTVAVDFDDVAICNGETATITASGADTYLWSPNTFLSPSTTDATVILVPTATTTYTVVGTTAAGCSASASAKVTPMALVPSSVSYNPAENCAAGSLVTMSVSGLPETISNGGTWEYRFLASDGVTVLQDWSASSDFAFTPAEDSTYGHFYQVRSTSCIADVIDSVYTDIVIGFGADVAVLDYNCNSEGIITLSNPFGQIAIEELYANPLTDLATMTDFALTGNASVANGRLQLTPSATGNTGYAVLTVPNFSAGLNNSMNVSFNMTADMPINTYGTGGADGLTYSFGDDATPAGNGTGHNGKGTKLRLSFDAAGNSSENNNQAGIYLVYGWTATNAFGPASTPQTLAYSSNTSLWKLKTDIPVELSIDTDGKATVTVDGTVVFTDIQLPAAYMAADVTGWKHLFSAGTGGDALRQAVSNLEITAGNLNYGITAGGSATPPAAWQSGTVFDQLLPGEYDIWISKDEAGTCMKNIGTYEILNLNPVVELGNDTTICEGTSLTLDAGNTGSSYLWSGSNEFTQTIEVDEAGAYIAYVTDAVGCLGIGTINVDVNEAPTATGIYSQGSFPMMNFSVLGAQNADSYDWNFGDGNSVQNGPASVSHMYTQDGTFTVTVTLTNDCGTEVETTSITIIDYTGIGENELVDLNLYPNPASTQVTVSLPNSEESTYSVFSVSGSQVKEITSFYGTATLEVSEWESGIYFLTVTNQGKTTTKKFVVE